MKNLNAQNSLKFKINIEKIPFFVPTYGGGDWSKRPTFAIFFKGSSIVFLMAHIPDICHGSHGYIRGEKICQVEKFPISMHDRCGAF